MKEKSPQRPFADVCNKVMVAVGYLVGIPTSFQVPWVVYEVADVSVTTLLHHCFDAVVCQHRLEQCKRFDAVTQKDIHLLIV